MQTMSPASRATALPPLLVALAAVGAGPRGLEAQDVIELVHVATFPESFGLLQTVRPLSDGTVIVADPLGQVLARLDLGTGSIEPVGREGRGPGEWSQPDAVYPLPGDSTLLVDLGNAQLSVVDPRGRVVDSHPMMLETGGPMGMEIVRPGGTDRMGRVYYQARSGMGPRAGPDSSRVKRWVPGEERGTRIAALRPPAVNVGASGGRGTQRMGISPIPLAPQDAWAVAPDGGVAVVRADPYRVEWVRGDGTTVRGPALAYRPVPVGTAEKERYLDEMAASGLATTVTVENGVRSVGFRRGGRGRMGGMGGGGADRAREIREMDWPQALPAIREGGALIAPDGRLWVERFVAVGEPTRYDVFDRAGHRVATASLPAGRRVIGFDGDRLFVVRVDELGLNWLEVYRPAAG